MRKLSTELGKREVCRKNLMTRRALIIGVAFVHGSLLGGYFVGSHRKEKRVKLKLENEECRIFK